MRQGISFRHHFCVVASCLPAAMVSAGPIGASQFVIATNAWFPDVAYDSVDGKYLVVSMQYPNPVQIHGRFITSAGALSGAGFPISSSPGTFFPGPHATLRTTRSW